MLQTIRDKITGWFAYLFLGAIAVVFIFWGVQMRSATGVSNSAATVNGEEIPIAAVNRAWQERQQQLQQMLHTEIPEALKKQQQQAVLDEYIRTQLLSQHTSDLGYYVSNEQLRNTINGFPDTQVDGKFSPERYAFLLRQQGRNKTQFEQELRSSLRINQLQNGIVASAFVTPAELQRRQALEGEQRDIDYAVVPMSGFLPTVTVNDADLQAWYEAHKNEYLTDETVDLDYLELRLADMEKEIEVTDAALQEAYEQAKERLTTPERRMARHILITVGDNVDDATAKKKAEELLAKIKAGGDFAALAKQFSQDTVSAAKGGDLGWAGRDAYVGPFADALFSMSPGEIRGPVQTQFGYHIIQLEQVEGGKTKTFAEAREELTRDLRASKAQEKFEDRTQKLGDESFSALTELDTTAKSLNLTVQKISGFSRQGGGALGSDAKVIEAAFSTDAIEKHQNSSLIPVANDHAVVLRVTEHHAPEQKPFAAVRLAIEARLKEQAAKDAAAKRGADLLARVESGADWTKSLSEFKVTPVSKKSATRTEAAIPAPLRQTAFAVPRTAITPEKPVYRGVTIENGDYAVVRVNGVHAGAGVAGTPEMAAKQRQTAQSLGTEEFGAYLADITSRASIDKNPKVFE